MSQDIIQKIERIKSELSELGEKKREKLEELRIAEKELRARNNEQNNNLHSCSYCGDKEIYARSFCRTCYARFMKNGTPNRIEKGKKIPPTVIPWQDVLFEKVFEESRSNSYPPKPEDYNESVDIAIELLGGRNAEAITKRFRDGKTLQEVGEHFGVTRSRAYQIIEKSIRRLRSPRIKRILLYGAKAATEMEKKAIQNIKQNSN